MKVTERILFVALILFFSSSLSLCQFEGTSAGTTRSKVGEQQDYTFAVGLYRDGQYEMALREFESFLKNYPNSQRTDEVIFLSGECLVQMKMFDSALIDYRKVMDNYPTSSYYSRCELREGEIFVQLGKFDRAEELLKRILSGTDEDLKGEAAYKLGQMFVDKEDYNNAIKYFELSYEGYKNSGLADYAMYGSAWCFGKIGDYASAKQKFETLLSDYPDSKLRANAIEKIGECDFFQENYDQAIHEFISSITVSNDESVVEPALYYEGRAYELKTLPDSAISAYTEYIDKFPAGTHADEVRVLLSRLIIKRENRPREALQLLSKVGQGSRLYFDARLETAHAYETAGLPDSAEFVLKLLTVPPYSHREIATAYYELGKLYYNEERYSESVESFLSAAVDTSLYAEAMKNAALSSASSGNYNAAKAYFTDAITKLSGEELTKAHIDYAAALYAAKDYSDAAQIFLTAERLSNIDKEKAEALYMAAESFYRARDYSSALGNYKRYLEKYPDGTHANAALMGIGYSYYFSNKFTDAAHTFQRFIDSNEGSPLLLDAYLRLGDAYYYNKDYAKAMKVYKDAASKFSHDSSSAYAVYQVGESNYWLGNYEAAISTFRFLLKSYPSSSLCPDAQFATGWVYFAQKQYRRAIAEFDSVVVNYPDSPSAARALYSEGDAYYNLQDYGDALAKYQALLAKYPTSDYVDNAIVGMQYCLTVLGKSKEASTVIDAFVRDHPQLAHLDRIFYKKAEYALNQKHYTEAERDLKEFISKFPRSEILGKALYNLAIVEINLRKESEAIGVLSNLIDKQPWDDYTDAGRIKLAEIYEKRKEYGPAQTLLENAASSGGVYSLKAQTSLGKLYLAKEDTLDAESVFSKVVASSADSTDNEDKAEAKILLSGIYFNRGRSKEAIDLANEVARSRNDILGAEAQLKVANYYCDYGDSSNAVLAFLRVKYVFPSFSDIVAKSQIDLAECYAKFGRKQRAVSVLRDFLKGRSEDAYAKLAREKLKEFEAD
jgi:TolA-binding protein